jgi:hypothetical protein
MAIDQAQRPQFYEGQYLGADDLTATVEYSRLLSQRHDLGAHTWGIAIGLTLVETLATDGSNTVTIAIAPGYAWDGFGRPIVVLAPYPVSANLFQSIVYDPTKDNGVLQGRTYPVWLQYAEAPAQPPASGFASCGGNNQNSRVLETFQLVVGNLNPSAQRDPITIGNWVGDASLAVQQFDPSAAKLTDASIPHQDFPDDNSTANWLIPIGCLQWLPNQTAGQPGSFVPTAMQSSDSGPLKAAKQAFRAASDALRQYIGVVAAAVQAPDGLLRLKDRSNPPSAIPSSELVWVEGDLRVQGNVNLFGGVVDFKNPGGVDSNMQIQANLNSSGGEELELVIGNQNAGQNDLAIGPLDSKGNFTPEVVVLDNGNVGISTTQPTHKLHVDDNSGIRQNRLYISGGDTASKDVWCSLTYNAYHASDNSKWIFPDTSRSAVTIEMDDAGGKPRFQVFSTTNTATQAWNLLFALDGNSGNASLATTPTTSRFTINGQVAVQGLLNFFPVDADISYDGGSDSAFVIKAIGNATTGFVGGNVGIGTTTPAALLDIAGATKFDSSGGIASRKWNVSTPFSTIGPLPVNYNFNSNGGSLLLFVSGSGFSTTPGRQIGMQILIDGIYHGEAQVYTNEADSHKSFTANAFWIAGVPAGAHVLQIDVLPGTQTDFNDFFNATIMELPF